MRATLTVAALLVLGMLYWAFFVASQLTFPLRGGEPAPVASARPDELTDGARQHLGVESLTLTPVLEEVRTSGDVTRRAVEDALVATGYPARTVEVTYHGAGTAAHVAFTIEFEDGCLSGTVSRTRVDVQATGSYPGGGCPPPDTH
jgi:hypothetical protein